MAQNTGGRDLILGRIRRGLRAVAPRPHPKPPAAAERYARGLPMAEAVATKSDWLPRVGETWQEQADLFAANAADLKADFVLCDDEADLHRRLAALAESEGWTRIASHAGPLTSPAAESLTLPCLYTDGGYDPDELEKCAAALTGCEALIAQTGSVLVTARSAGGRALSILPPHHVVLATRGQLLPDLPSAFALLTEHYGGDYPSLMSFVTGPSRTGDIERILVLGAHGPKKLTIFCV